MSEENSYVRKEFIRQAGYITCSFFFTVGASIYGISGCQATYYESRAKVAKEAREFGVECLKKGITKINFNID